MDISKNKTQLCDKMHLKGVTYKKRKLYQKNCTVQNLCFFVNNSFRYFYTNIFLFFRILTKLQFFCKYMKIYFEQKNGLY